MDTKEVGMRPSPAASIPAILMEMKIEKNGRSIRYRAVKVTEDSFILESSSKDAMGGICWERVVFAGSFSWTRESTDRTVLLLFLLLDALKNTKQLEYLKEERKDA